MVGTDPQGTRVCLGCFCGSQETFKTGNECVLGVFPAPLLHSGSRSTPLLIYPRPGEAQGVSGKV